MLLLFFISSSKVTKFKGDLKKKFEEEYKDGKHYHMSFNFDFFFIHLNLIIVDVKDAIQKQALKLSEDSALTVLMVP